MQQQGGDLGYCNADKGIVAIRVVLMFRLGYKELTSLQYNFIRKNCRYDTIFIPKCPENNNFNGIFYVFIGH